MISIFFVLQEDPNHSYHERICATCLFNFLVPLCASSNEEVLEHLAYRVITKINECEMLRRVSGTWKDLIYDVCAYKSLHEIWLFLMF